MLRARRCLKLRSGVTGHQGLLARRRPLLREWDDLGYDQSVLDLVFHANAERVLGL